MATLSVVVKKALVVTVILLLLVAGLPLLALGMSHGHCSTCGPAALAMATCMVVLAAAVAAIELVARRRRLRRLRALELLRAVVFDRPPRVLAFA